MATTTHATDKLSLASPDGQMQMTFMLTNQGEPVYDLSFKGKAVINPSKLGLELNHRRGRSYGQCLLPHPSIVEHVQPAYLDT